MRAICVLFVITAALPAVAQVPDMKGATVMSSAPGRAEAARTGQVKAEVVSLDKLTRAITLKGPSGRVIDVIAGAEVKNFDQLKPGDFVAVRYLQSLALELQKPGQPAAQYSDRPTARGREVRAIAKVTAMDPKKKTMSLTGPRGNTVTLDVRNPEQFKAVKVGDEIRVTYTEAVAISIALSPRPVR